MRIGVVDGQGGGIGSQIVKKLRQALGSEFEIIALGTNEMATVAMLKAKANIGATGENAICETVRKLDVVLGSMAIIIPNSMMGELTPNMAHAIAGGDCLKFLLPLFCDRVEVVGCTSEPLPHMVDRLVSKVEEVIEGSCSFSV